MKTNRRDRPDFIQVQLTPAGLAFAGQGATVRFATAHMHYVFTGTKPVEVLRRPEWTTLQRHVDAQGNPLLQPFLPATASAPVEVAETVNQVQEG